jgi:predicted nucleic acid-binding protein
MILLDTNVLLRLLTRSDDPLIYDMHTKAVRVFRAIQAGEIEAMVSDCVLAEVAFLLTSPRHYSVPVPEVAEKLAAIIRLRNLRVSDRPTLLHALDIWAEQPALGFVDSLTAAQSRRLDVELFTFDRDFDTIAGIKLWTTGEG